MFTQLKNIDTAFSHVKRFSLLVILACVAVSGFAVWKSFEMVREGSSKIYILANGKALEATAAERKDNVGWNFAITSRCSITGSLPWTPMKR